MFLIKIRYAFMYSISPSTWTQYAKNVSFPNSRVSKVFGNGSHGHKIYVIVQGPHEFYVSKNNNELCTVKY